MREICGRRVRAWSVGLFHSGNCLGRRDQCKLYIGRDWKWMQEAGCWSCSFGGQEGHDCALSVMGGGGGL